MKLSTYDRLSVWATFVTKRIAQRISSVASDLLLKWQIVEQVIQKKSFYLYFLVENHTSCIIYEGTIIVSNF